MSLDLSVGELKPPDVILPFLSLHSNRAFREFLGTGFFVGEPLRYVTAAHNVEGRGEHFGVVQIDELGRIYRASVRHVDSENDIAVLDITSYRPSKWLALPASTNVHLNLPVICFEYGTTVVSGREPQFGPATRIGNITRVFKQLDILNRSLSAALEVSFPALRGASGAPVFTSNGFVCVGMMIGNMSYHLMLAQIETVFDDAGKPIEEVRYMLPQGIAVGVEAIARALAA